MFLLCSWIWNQLLPCPVIGALTMAEITSHWSALCMWLPAKAPGLTINTVLSRNGLKARSPRSLHNLYCSQIGFSSFNFSLEHCDQPKCAVVGCCSKLSCCNSVVFLLLGSLYYPLQLTLKSRIGTLLFFPFAVQLLPVLSQLVTLAGERDKSTARIYI